MPLETPQETINILQTVVGLIPVIIGGLLTAGGGFLGAYITHKLNRKSTKKEQKRERLELLVTLAYKTMHWLDGYKNEVLFGGDKIEGASPLSELEMLSELYFPELSDERSKVILAAINYQEWVLEGKQIIIKGQSLSEDYKTKFNTIYRELTNSVSALAKKSGTIIRENENS